MIIKMTNNTSRTSISGTTFMSAMLPWFSPPTGRPISHLAPHTCPRGGLSHPATKPLLTGLELGGDQADFVDACAAHNVNGAGNVHEEYVAVAFDESDFVGALFENRFQARAQ